MEANASNSPTQNEYGYKSKPLLAAMFLDFLFPKYTKWIDLQLYSDGGYYKLIQMKVRLRDNKKIFKTKTLGFINDYTIKDSIRQKILVENI